MQPRPRRHGEGGKGADRGTGADGGADSQLAEGRGDKGDPDHPIRGEKGGLGGGGGGEPKRDKRRKRKKERRNQKKKKPHTHTHTHTHPHPHRETKAQARTFSYDWPSSRRCWLEKEIRPSACSARAARRRTLRCQSAAESGAQAHRAGSRSSSEAGPCVRR